MTENFDESQGDGGAGMVTAMRSGKYLGSIISENWVLLSALSAQLILVWGFEFFPTIDGPAHVHLAYGLKEAYAGNEFYADYFKFNDHIAPNLFTELFLFAVVWLVNPFAAEKALLSVYFIGFGVASVYLTKAVNQRASHLALFLFFLSINFNVWFGFYNFSFSMVLIMLWLDYWLRHKDKSGWKIIIVNTLFSLAAYFTHLFAFLGGILAIFSVGSGVVIQQFSQETGKYNNGLALKKINIKGMLGMFVPVILGSLPVILLALHYLSGRLEPEAISSGVVKAASGGIYIEKLIHLFSGDVLGLYSLQERISAGLFLVLLLSLVLLLVRRHPDYRAAFPFFWGLLIFLLLYMILPFWLMVRWMPLRFLTFVYVMGILWFIALVPRDVDTRNYAYMVLFLFMITSYFRYDIFHHLNSRYQEFVSVKDSIKPNSTLVALRLSKQGEGSGPFIQVGSHLATLTQSVDLKNFQGQSKEHPIQFISGRSAYAALGGDSAITAVPPHVNIMAYEQATGRAIDYILLWGETPEFFETEADALRKYIESHYELIKISGPLGLQYLYEKKADS